MSRRLLVGRQLAALAPLAPDSETGFILDHAVDSPGLRKAAPATAAWLSLIAYVRHNFTDYDAMLNDGYDVASARHFCLAEINEVLKAWGCRRLVRGDEEDPQRGGGGGGGG